MEIRRKHLLAHILEQSLVKHQREINQTPPEIWRFDLEDVNAILTGDSDKPWIGALQDFVRECGPTSACGGFPLLPGGLPKITGDDRGGDFFKWSQNSQISFIGEKSRDGGAFRDVVALGRYDQNSGKWDFTCSGVIVGDRTIYTARHCVTVTEGANEICRPFTHFYLGQGLAADNFLDNVYPLIGELEVEGQRCVEGENIEVSSHADIAIQIFSSPNIHGYATSLPFTDALFFLVVGFGENDYSTKFGIKNASILEINYTQCDDCINGVEFAIKPTNGSNNDSCYGDSGGGLFQYRKVNGFSLVALVSRGIDNQQDCGQGGIYTRFNRF